MTNILRRLSRPAWIALGYLAVATAWILTSDGLVALLATDQAALARAQTWKGAAFVLVTSLALYALLRAVYPSPETTQNEIVPSERHRAGMLALVFVALTATIIGFGTLAYQHQAAAFKSRQYHQQSAIAELKAGQIGHWADWRRRSAEQFGRDPDLRESIRQTLKPDADKPYHHIRQHFDVLLETGRWVGVGLYATDGRPLLLAGRGRPADATLGRAIAETAASGKFLINDLRGIQEPDYCIDFLVPVHAGQAGDQPGAVLVLSADPRELLFQMVQSWPIPSASSETLLIRPGKDGISYLTPRRQTGDNPQVGDGPIAIADPLAEKAARQKEGVVEVMDYRGKSVLAAFRPVEGTSWLIVTKTDTDEVMLPLRQQARLILLVILLAIGITGIFVAFLWRGQRTAFATWQQRNREDREALVRHFNSLFKHARDTILLIDQGGRIVEANDAAVASYDYSAEELRQRNVLDLIAPQAQPGFEADFQAADRPGGVLFETEHRRKDGSTFPVEISARTITIQGKGYRQSFIRDITERKRHETEIRRLNKAYATLSQTNEAIVRLSSRDELFDRVCRVAVESGGYLGAWIGLLDEASQSLVPVASAGKLDDYIHRLNLSVDPARPDGRGPSGHALREGRPYYCNDFLGDPATAPWHDLAREFGFRASAALPLVRRNAVIGTLSLYSTEAGVFDEKMRALLEEMAKDVSFALENFDREAIRRQAEADLRESEALFRSVVEQNIAAIFMIEDGRIVLANPRACEILGYAVGELNGMNTLDLIDERDRADIADMMRRILAREVESIERVFRGLRKDGSLVDVGARATYVLTSGKPGILGVAQDIGERKKAQEEIQRYMHRLEQAMMATVEAVSTMVELRDPYTSGHERRVGELAAAIGGEMGLSMETITGLRMTGYVHDIGKISVPAEILSKPGRLTEIEFEIIKTHARSGYDVLKNVEFPWPLPEVILQHHERLDGSGYPQHLKGDEIILEARIMAVADVVESMASHRPYRPALGVDKALEEIERNSGKYYAPQVAEACLRLFREKGYELPK